VAAVRLPSELSPELLATTSIKKSSGLFWAAVSVFVLGSLFGLIYSQTDIFHPERARAKAELAERQRQEQAAALARSQVKPGEITIDSTPGEAAVWLLLGRTPVDSFKVPASKVHELRLEHEGYLPLDLPVSAVHWTEKDGQLRAEVRAKLVPGAPKKPVPAFPPQPETPLAAGAEGNGVIHVESSPSGTQVWMLIGLTPNVRLAGIPAGEDYEFKLLKDGYRPGFTVVRESEWYLAGPDSPVRPSMERSVELAKIGPRPKKSDRSRKKR
jgi:hypothetical protein